MRERILICIIIGIFFFPVLDNIAQERQNPTIPAKITDTIGELRNASGWQFSTEHKKWISEPNKIPHKEWTTDNLKQLGEDNFNFFRFSHLEYKGKPYYILIKEFTGGRYKYPSISKGWYTYAQYWYGVFSKKQWLKLKNLKDRTPNLLTMYVLYSDNGYGNVYNSHIEKKVDFEKFRNLYESGIYFRLYAYPMKDKGLIQFYIYNTIEDLRKRKHKPYYEIKISEFNRLFGLDKK